MGHQKTLSVSGSSAGACLRKSEAGIEGVSHGGILTAKAEVVKRRRKRATNDRKVGALLKGTVRSDSVRVLETSSRCSAAPFWAWITGYGSVTRAEEKGKGHLFTQHGEYYMR